MKRFQPNTAIKGIIFIANMFAVSAHRGEVVGFVPSTPPSIAPIQGKRADLYAGHGGRAEAGRIVSGWTVVRLARRVAAR